MAGDTVNREEQGSQVLSVRLSKRELMKLQRILRNFEIQGDSMSEQLRALFRMIYWSSVRWSRSNKREAL